MAIDCFRDNDSSNNSKVAVDSERNTARGPSSNTSKGKSSYDSNINGSKLRMIQR